MTNSSPAARTAWPARGAAHAEYVRERARLTIPAAEIAAASDLELLMFYDVQGRETPGAPAQEHARHDNLERLYTALIGRGVQW